MGKSTQTLKCCRLKSVRTFGRQGHRYRHLLEKIEFDRPSCCSGTYCIVSAKCEDSGSFMRRFLLHRQADKLDGRTHMQFLPRLIPPPRMIGCSTFDLPERRNCMECVCMSSLEAS
jgi:hypothetical protein